MHPFYSLGKRSKRIYNSGIHRDLKLIIDGALEVCPIDFTLTDGKRTAAEQRKLWEIGRRFDAMKGYSEKDQRGWDIVGRIVTKADGYVRESRHQSGKAVDVCCHIPGRPDLAYDKIHMAVLIGSFLTIADMLFYEGQITHGLRSGADWDSDTQYLEPGTFHDMPHLELIDP